MRQYELAIRIAQVHHLAEERKYRKALSVIETIDMRLVRNVSDLKVFAEVYTRTEQFMEAKNTYMRIYKKSRTRRILYRLIYLAIRTNDLKQADSFYKEYVKMNPNSRDTIILRYRIDKAAGVPIGQLIDTLKSLKEEEYIEEWAYELAKLYQKAGRFEECRDECEDIMLWFGQGEIVERAKLLLEHIDENDSMPFMDDKDFTDKLNNEAPNPNDTASLPELHEYLHSDNDAERKLLKKADPEKYEELEAKEFAEDEELWGEPDENEEFNLDPQPAPVTSSKVKPISKEEAKEKERVYEDDMGEATQALPEIARSANAGNEAVEAVQPDSVPTPAPAPAPRPKVQVDDSQFPRISQSGTGITQDLAAEISAIFEAEQQEQLKEKAVTVIQEFPNMANDVVERMTESGDQLATKEYIPVTSSDMPVQDDEEFEKTNVVPSLDGDSSLVAGVPEPTALQDVAPDDVQGYDYSDYDYAAYGEEDLSPEAALMSALEEEVIAAAQKIDPEAFLGDPALAGTEEELNMLGDNASATGEILPEKDLPTTRALHRSFADILILIGGELDPSHFVLMGDGDERILGISKKISVVMRETGYLSSGRIARIDAETLNKMDLMQFKPQLKGNCLLVTRAADLLFPTITKIFSIMDEYYGDFAVILSDEGATLDQLFRFVPALSRRFKYIIDISQYTEQDYR